MQKLKLQFVGHCIGCSVSDLHMSFRQMGHDISSSSSAAPPTVGAVDAILFWLFIVRESVDCYHRRHIILSLYTTNELN